MVPAPNNSKNALHNDVACGIVLHSSTLPMKKVKSISSILTTLIAEEDDSSGSSPPSTGVDVTVWAWPETFPDGDPKSTLRDVLGDLFIDADHLEKKEMLGEGGFAVVHRCLYEDPRTRETIMAAMKELKPHLITNLDDLREFIMEASTQRKLHHRNIVKILGIGATDYTSIQTMRASMFILQEYVPGKSLKDIVIQQMCDRMTTVYSIKRAIHWLLDVASALHYLHHVCRPMIIHRDLKLDNILLSQNGKTAKLCDFGLHKRLRNQGLVNSGDGQEDSYYGGGLYQALMDSVKEDEPSQDSGGPSPANWSPEGSNATAASHRKLLDVGKCRSHSWKFSSSIKHRIEVISSSERPERLPSKMGFTGKVGSIIYMAPEVFMNRTYDEKVDVFSFGVMMYELLAQTSITVKHGMLEANGTLSGYAEKVSQGFRETIPRHWPDYVKMLVSECWDQEPSNRPSFKDIIHRLSLIRDSGIAEKVKRPVARMSICPPSCCGIQ